MGKFRSVENQERSDRAGIFGGIPIPEHQQKKNCWKEVLFHLKVLDRLIFTVPNVALLFAAMLIPSICLIVFNLICVLRNVRYYQTMRFSMQETVINGEEVWEVSFSQTDSSRQKKSGSWKLEDGRALSSYP